MQREIEDLHSTVDQDGRVKQELEKINKQMELQVLYVKS